MEIPARKTIIALFVGAIAIYLLAVAVPLTSNVLATGKTIGRDGIKIIRGCGFIEGTNRPDFIELVLLTM